MESFTRLKRKIKEGKHLQNRRKTDGLVVRGLGSSYSQCLPKIVKNPNTMWRLWRVRNAQQFLAKKIKNR